MKRQKQKEKVSLTEVVEHLKDNDDEVSIEIEFAIQILEKLELEGEVKVGDKFSYEEFRLKIEDPELDEEDS